MKGMKLWATVAAAAACAALIWVMAANFGKDPHEVPFMLSGKPAPAFTVDEIGSGQSRTLASYAGKPLVVNFWASWCEPCKAEHPVLEWGARNFASQASFIGVVFEDTEDNAKDFLQRNGQAFPQMLDSTGRMAVDYGCSGVPETYFIDAKGTILTKHIGPIDPRTLADYIRKLSSPQPAPSASDNP